jgi:hypothetical protein
LVAWGASQYGQLGTGTSANGWTPVPVAAGGVLAGRTVTSIIAGSTHSLVLCADGTPIGWGNISGSVGSSNYPSVPVGIPTASLGSGERITALAAGSSAKHSLASVAVPLSGDSSLSAIALNPGRLVQPLTPGLTGYVASVPHGTTAVSVTPIASDPDAIITVNGLALAAGGISPPIAVASGVDIIIRVTAPNGVVTSYTITVRDDSMLAGLALSGGSLVPEFSPAVAAYTASMPTATDSITLTPTAADGPALIEVAGVPVVSGTASQSLPLVAGENLIRVSVTAPDGHTTIYQLTIIRQVPLVFSYPSATAVPVTAAAYTAIGNTVEFALGFVPETGSRLTVVDHTGLGFITGEFANLRHGQVISLSYQNTNYHFWANYYGGPGNDLVLEWVNHKRYAFGPNSYGQLGDGTAIQRAFPAPVVASGVLLGKTVVTLSAGYGHSAALCSDGSLATWRYNPGVAGTSVSLAPTAVSTIALGSGERFTALAVGSSAYHLVAIAAAPDSANSRLAELTLNPGSLTPAFSPGTTTYTVKVPDPDGDALTVTAAGPASMAGGTGVLRTDSILYTPPGNFSGLDGFRVTVTDAAGASATNTVFVTLGPGPNGGGAGVNPPVLTSLPDGKLALAFQGIPGRTYVVPRSVNGLGNWVTLATVGADASGKVSFTDESPPAGSAFYRLGLP